MAIPAHALAQQTLIEGGGDAANRSQVDALLPDAQRRLEEQQVRSEQQGLLSNALSEADQRADITFNQLRQAGALNAAQQFKNARKRIAFDTARRGTLGGSRSIERAGEAEAGLQQNIAQNLLNAQSAANQQREGDIASIFGVQQQVAQGDPFVNVLRNQQVMGIGDRLQSAQGQFSADQLQEQSRALISGQRGQAIAGGLGALATGIEGIATQRQDDALIQALQGLRG